MSDVLRDDEVTLNRIEALAKQALMSTDRQQDGELVLREGGMRVFVNVDTDRKIMTFFAAWSLRSRFSMEEKLQFANGQNTDKILVRFTVPQPDTFWCDYALLYEGGITPFSIINTYKRFVAVCRSVVDQDEKGLLGDD
jgi:hypothetical protein